MENLLLNVKNLEIKFKTINGVFDAVKKISFQIIQKLILNKLT